MTWYYVTGIIVAILVGATGIIIAIIKGIWTLASLFGDLKTSIVELRLSFVTTTFKIDETQKDLAKVTDKVENVQLTQQSLQARTIRLEEKVDNLKN